MKLQEAEDAVKDGEGWLSLEELKAAMEAVANQGKKQQDTFKMYPFLIMEEK